MHKKLISIGLALVLAFGLVGCQSTTASPSAAPSQTVIQSPEASSQQTQGQYTHAYVQTLQGGFVDTIEDLCQQQGWTTDTFKAVCEKAAADMTAEELQKMNAIRAAQIQPTEDTLLQKVITLYDMNKYLSGEYKTPKGFVSVCADTKQYTTIEDLYYGLRLDYEGTYFKPQGENYAVLRFKATNIDQAVVPKSPANGGNIEDPYPFGGAGFTTGTNGRWGSPEWTMGDEFTVLVDGAELYEIQADGTEILRGVYSAEAGVFQPIA